MENQHQIRICDASIPPQKPPLDQDLDLLLLNNDRTLIGGYLNSKHAHWNSKVLNKKAELLPHTNKDTITLDYNTNDDAERTTDKLHRRHN